MPKNILILTNCVGGLNVQRDGLSGQGLNKDCKGKGEGVREGCSGG